MARYRITAPVAHVVSTVAGVGFNDSVGHTDNESALHYFRRQGYKVEDLDEIAKAEAEDAKAAKVAERKAKAEADAAAKAAADEAAKAALAAKTGGTP